MNKREFMRVGAGAVVAGASWPTLALDAAGTGPTGRALLGDNPLRAWQRRVGVRFVLEAGQVVALDRVDLRSECAATSQFTLVFAVEEGQVTPGSTLLRAEDGSRHALYLAAAGSKTGSGQPLLRSDCALLV